MSRVRVPTSLLSIKKFCETYLRQTKGVMHLIEKAKNEMTIEVLKTVQFMINHGFYEDQ